MVFDIAHADALDMIKIEQDKEFLIDQRKPGRPGCMLGVDKITAHKEKRKLERQQHEVMKKQKSDEREESSKLVSMAELTISGSEDSQNSSDSDESDVVELETSQPQCSSLQRPKQTILNPRFSAVLDKVKISDRDTVHLLTACLDSLNLNPEEYILNRESIRQSRQNFREESAKIIKSNFMDSSVEYIFVHWDSKLLPHLTGLEKVDRLPVVASGNDIEQLLGVPQIPSSCGAEVSSAVYDTLEDWNLLDKAQGCVFDTTASNTRRIQGASFLLQQKLGKEILFLACRHHILELLLQAAVSEADLYVSSGPDIPVFKRFRENWKNIIQDKISDWSTNEKTKKSLDPVRDEILSFCKSQISEEFPREDYKEFLNLICIVLGSTPEKKMKIRKPGAYHQARWMAKGLYCLKLFLYRKQFALSAREEGALVRIVIFLIKIYIKPWCLAMVTSSAPINDINLIRTLTEYLNKDKIAETCLKKFINHLWYLNEETATFALFDEKLSLEVKKSMVETLINCREDEVDEVDEEDDDGRGTEKKLNLKYTEIATFLQGNLPSTLLGPNSWNIFKKLKINTSFMEVDPSLWYNNPDYCSGKNKIKNIRVVNDTAERSVKLMEEYNNKLTKNEEQTQFILQVVQKYRKKYPRDTREVLRAKFQGPNVNHDE